MNFKRSLFAGACAPLVLLAGAAAADDRIRVTIGWVPPDVTGVFARATSYFEAAAASAAEHGIDVELLTRAPAAHTAFADQVNIVEDLISRRVDVIAISPTEVEVVRPVLGQAAERGIPVIMVNVLDPIPGLDIAAYIGFDNSDAAAVTAFALLDYFGGPGVLGLGEKVEMPEDGMLDLAFWRELYGNMTDEERAAIVANGVIIEGLAGGFFSTARLEGFNSVIADFPNVTVMGAPCASDWNRARAAQCTEDFMQAHREGMDFIFAPSNDPGLGAMQALASAGRLQTAADPIEIGGPRAAVFTQGVTSESIGRINDGMIIAETTHGFADWGWFGAEFAVRIACGLEVPKTFDVRPRVAFVDNTADFYPTPALPAIDWAGIKAECSPRVN